MPRRSNRLNPNRPSAPQQQQPQPPPEINPSISGGCRDHQIKKTLI